MEIRIHFVLVGLVCLLIVSLLVVLGSTEGGFLVVNYPEHRNQSYVILTCVGNAFGDPLTEAQRPATFLRNGLEITADSVMFVTEKTNVSISFVFNQSQEGAFICRTRDGSVSNAVELVGN